MEASHREYGRELDEEYKEITGQICPLSAVALTPLIREKDSEIRVKAIKSIGKRKTCL